MEKEEILELAENIAKDFGYRLGKCVIEFTTDAPEYTFSGVLCNNEEIIGCFYIDEKRKNETDYLKQLFAHEFAEIRLAADFPTKAEKYEKLRRKYTDKNGITRTKWMGKEDAKEFYELYKKFEVGADELAEEKGYKISEKIKGHRKCVLEKLEKRFLMKDKEIIRIAKEVYRDFGRYGYVGIKLGVIKIMPHTQTLIYLPVEESPPIKLCGPSFIGEPGNSDRKKGYIDGAFFIREEHRSDEKALRNFFAHEFAEMHLTTLYPIEHREYRIILSKFAEKTDKLSKGELENFCKLYIKFEVGADKLAKSLGYEIDKETENQRKEIMAEIEKRRSTAQA